MKNKTKAIVAFFMAAIFLTALSSCEKENSTPACNQDGTPQLTEEQTN